MTNVFEFREGSWHVDAVFALLDRYGASFCTHDMIGMEVPRLAVGPAAYVRFHGGEGKYWGRYSDEHLLPWAEWLVEQKRQGKNSWVYFNNDIEGHAIQDAMTLRAMLAQLHRPSDLALTSP